MLVDTHITSFRLPSGDSSRRDSYLLSLRAILEHAGRPVDYDLLAGLTGVAFVAGAWDVEPCYTGKCWPKQRQLPFVGDALGIRWRYIWPEESGINSTLEAILSSPTAIHANGPAVSTASAPDVIGWSSTARQALLDAIGTTSPVLIQGGWPDEATHQWGCLTEIHSTQGRFVGLYPGAYRPVELTGTPSFAICVDGCTTPLYTPHAALLESLKLAAAVDSPLDTPPNGTARQRSFYDQWIDHLLSSDFGSSSGLEPWECHLHLSASTRNARMAALRYISLVREHLPAHALLALDELEACYEKITRILTRDSTRDYVRSAYESTEEQFEMADRLSLVKRYERQALSALRRLSLSIG